MKAAPDAASSSQLGHAHLTKLAHQPGDHDTEMFWPRPAAVVAGVHPVGLDYDRHSRPLIGGRTGSEANLLLVWWRQFAGGWQASQERGHPIGGGLRPRLSEEDITG